jgi:hypothetical protein
MQGTEKWQGAVGWAHHEDDERRADNQVEKVEENGVAIKDITRCGKGRTEVVLMTRGIGD